MANDPVKKRKATEQLSPYSQEPIDEESNQDRIQERNDKPSRKAKLKKNQQLDKRSLKGIFGNVVLSEEPKATNKTEMKEMVAGLNNSFLKAVQVVLKKQSSKDIRYLFEQYNKFMKDIEENIQ